MASQQQAQQLADEGKSILTRLGGNASVFNWAAIVAEIQAISDEVIAAVKAFFGLTSSAKHRATAIDWQALFGKLLAAAPQLLSLVMTIIDLFKTPAPAPPGPTPAQS